MSSRPADEPLSGSRHVTVVLVEDDPPTRDHLAETLAACDGIRLLASAGTLQAARDACERFLPTVLITDLQLPDGHGADLIREVRHRYPATEIMVISVLGDESSVVTAIRAGASGYILKDSEPVDMVEAVHGLIEGRSPISASIARYIIRRVQDGSFGEDRKPAPLLTPRETDILWGIAKGFTYNDIADRLGLSRQTVPSYIKNIYRKLEVNSRSEAVFEAIERKLIRLGE
ncbi:DNA-binding NarL/FixJ family response regulator [Azospirillum agricola]|uniref:response regulator n=1 Tax=Azospirillum agricola TaxID=1720247 RepID=UPI001AE5EA47|nr:response regulator transcription factor [Azospirillum agricola]MBP2230766.1 DNA-binding NarL/FixJ family response regulator [Azospirillum agricola]